jgi:SNF2 family DNA or RNA helicase
MNVFKYHGSQEQREVMKEELRNYLPGARRLPGMKPLDAIIVSYPYFSTENGSDRSFLRKFKFNYLVCDEAHILKNAQGMRYRNLDKNSSLRRLLLSGTPVQNSPKELLGKCKKNGCLQLSV